jgi:hypothetical protein
MKRSLAGLVLAGSLLAPTAAFAAPAAPCDSYSGTCPKTPAVKPIEKVRVKGIKHTLPITGGEFVGLIVLGAGGVGAGSAFVLAGRKRRGQHA